MLVFPDVTVFRAWLEEQRGVLVGRVMQIFGHPLAAWLSEVNRRRCWVDTGFYGISAYRFPLPEWAQLFDQAITEEFWRSEWVTGAQALAVLDSVI